ncbi:hypothetical protein JCM18918_1817 [Cutibacterium acnes JCM 18918]|nr:hypothetical protein JCM18918_1817 [Cutibacterium acnes JCM 18918]
MNNLIKIMSARKEFGGVITFIVHPDFIRDGRFYPVIPKTIQMVINEAATRPKKLYFIDQDTSAPVKKIRTARCSSWMSRSLPLAEISTT